jgi:glycosyltransferase involved in cell wall biosynthesis
VKEPTRELLFVHFGDALLRGSERCLLNLLQSFGGQREHLTLWCNQASLAEAAAPWVGEVVLSEFRPAFGLGSPDNTVGALRHLRALVAQGVALARRRCIGLIYCNSMAPCQWMVPVSLWLDLPLVVQLHTNYLPKSRLTSLAYAASHIVGVSQFCVQSFEVDGFPATHLSVVYNGVEVPRPSKSRATMRQELQIADDCFVVSSVGALVDWKRVDLLVEAVRAVPAELRGRLRLLVAGAGPCWDALRAQSAGLPVSFLGWRTDIADILNASDCIAVAAEKEAFGLTVIEAAALRLPVIAARAGGLPEVVDDRATGLLFAPGSATECALHMQALMVQDGLRSALGERAFLAYESKFTVSRMTNHLRGVVNAAGAAHISGQSERLGRSARLLYLGLSSMVHRVAGMRARN